MLAPKSRVLQNLGHFLVQHRRLFCKIGSKSRQTWMPVLQIFVAGFMVPDAPFCKFTPLEGPVGTLRVIAVRVLYTKTSAKNSPHAWTPKLSSILYVHCQML